LQKTIPSVFEFSDGNKKLNIPIQTKRSLTLLIPFLQGIFSTDGKFVIDRGYPRIGLDSATRSLIEEIDYILKKLGLNPRKYVWNRKNGNKLYGLYLKGKKQVKLFAQKINFIGKKNKLLNEYIKSIAPK
jgi:intein/homing endonuclease